MASTGSKIFLRLPRQSTKLPATQPFKAKRAGGESSAHSLEVRPLSLHLGDTSLAWTGGNREQTSPSARWRNNYLPFPFQGQ